jgi:AcrR family transcriptional regulator
MEAMARAYERTGRTSQKARTRAALVDAATALIGEGVPPTVEQVADRAQVGRATAYRYFPNQDELWAATYPETERPSLLELESDDPVARLDAVVEAFTRQMVDHEPLLRAMLRRALDPARDGEPVPFRVGRRLLWLEDALEPLRDRLPEADFARLVRAIGATVGIEALVWLTDMGGLSREDAVAVMRRSARTLLEGALAEAG